MDKALNLVNTVENGNMVKRIHIVIRFNAIATGKFGNHIAGILIGGAAQVHSLPRRNVNPKCTHYIYLYFLM